MSTRSDVGIALKNNVFEALSAETRDFLAAVCKEYKHEEGVFFHGECLKWYRFDCGSVEKLYCELEQLDEEGFRLIEGCYEYPDLDEGTVGGWVDNPWSVYKDISVSIDFCHD